MRIGRKLALNVEKECFMLFNSGINPKSRYPCFVVGIFYRLRSNIPQPLAQVDE